jgi:hypothetical protein
LGGTLPPQLVRQLRDSFRGVDTETCQSVYHLTDIISLFEERQRLGNSQETLIVPNWVAILLCRGSFL